MSDSSFADLDARLRRLERQNRVLVALLCAALALGSIVASNAQPTVLTASEVRAQRFALVDPSDRVAAEWSTPTCLRLCN